MQLRTDSVYTAYTFAAHNWQNSNSYMWTKNMVVYTTYKSVCGKLHLSPHGRNRCSWTYKHPKMTIKPIAKTHWQLTSHEGWKSTEQVKNNYSHSPLMKLCSTRYYIYDNLSPKHTHGGVQKTTLRSIYWKQHSDRFLRLMSPVYPPMLLDFSCSWVNTREVLYKNTSSIHWKSPSSSTVHQYPRRRQKLG
jgi:hypothetical protein